MSSHFDRQIKLMLYQFKRQYAPMKDGGIDIYQLKKSEVDLCTGLPERETDVFHIKKAVVLPARASAKFVQNVSKISADRFSAFGGTYDIRSRVFIVDRDDAPELNLTDDDWLVYRGMKYEVKHFDEFEFDTAYVIVADSVCGDLPKEARGIQVCAEDRIIFDEAN